MTVPFYRAFEDRHRGSRELIHGRQQIYLPFLTPLKQLYDECTVLDLGCGRGEWLEILLQNDFKPLGIDLDAGMLEACQTLGLPAEQGDALKVLQEAADESYVVVSGFHIAEHIPFSDLKELVAQALRVLRPAGLLILETPNAENIVVGTQNFYLDPTHERPIPHLLLSFLTEHSGFVRSKLLRLQESPELATSASVDLMSVLGGASPDYAIVAQKDAGIEFLDQFNPAFDQDYGLPLEVLASRYDAQAEWRRSELEARSVELREELQEVNSHVVQAEQHGHQLDVTMRELLGRSANSEARLTGLELGANQVRQQLQEVAMRAQLAEARFQQGELMHRESVSRAAEAEARLSAAHAMNEVLQTQLKTTSGQVQVLEAQAQTLSLSLHEQTQHVMRLEVELTDLEAEYQRTALEQLAPQQQELARRMAQLEDAQDREELLEAQLDSCKDQVLEMEAHIKLLEAAHFQASEEIQHLQEVLLGHEQQKEKLQQLMDEQLADHQQLKDQLKEQLMDHDQLKVCLAEMEWHKDVAERERNSANSSVQELMAQVEVLNARLKDSVGHAHHWWSQSKTSEERIDALLGSTSWRLTWPLRGLRNALVIVLKSPIYLLRFVSRPLLKCALRVVLNRPNLRARLNAYLKRHPKLHAHLKRFSRNKGMLPKEPALFAESSSVHPSFSDFADEVESLLKGYGVAPVTATNESEDDFVPARPESELAPAKYYSVTQASNIRGRKGPLESWIFK